jgi:hypothetical protein
VARRWVSFPGFNDRAAEIVNGQSPFEPRQHVIICLDDPESGGTLGYYGTIVRVLGRSKTEYPDQPDLWHYRVSIPAQNRKVNVPSCMLLATGILDPCEFADLDGKIAFDERPHSDNHELSGSYRLPARGVTYFTFRKSAAPVATYQLAMQMDSDPPESILVYHVPQKAKLNREYVRQAIFDLLGFGSS